MLKSWLPIQASCVEVVVAYTGMAGSGKTSLLQRINAHLHEKAVPGYLINLDPAVVSVPYPANIDIRDTVRACRYECVGLRICTISNVRWMIFVIDCWLGSYRDGQWWHSHLKHNCRNIYLLLLFYWCHVQAVECSPQHMISFLMFNFGDKASSSRVGEV